MPPHEGDEHLVLQQHILLKDLDVGLGLPQSVNSASNKRVTKTDLISSCQNYLEKKASKASKLAKVSQ